MLRRLRLPTLICVVSVLVVALFPTTVHGQDQSRIDHVQRAKHGPDLSGKDGPMGALGSELIRLYQKTQLDRAAPTTKAAWTNGLQIRDERVAVDAVATGSGAELRSDLERLGLSQGAVSGRLVSGFLPVSALDEAATLSALRTMRGAAGGGGVGAVTSEGDASLQTDEVRSDLNVDGSGVKTCVLSDSYDMAFTNAECANENNVCASDDVDSGDLPPDVDVVEEATSNQSNTDEGRGMLQIVHDIAPGAPLGFHTTQGGLANYADAISTLADPNGADCDVLVDDWIYFFEGMLQNGAVADAAKDAVNEDGKVYVTFAGNAGNRSYEAPFRGSGQDISTLSCCPNKSGEMHDFDSGAPTDVRQQITVGSGVSPNLALQWSDPWLDANSDLDLYLLDAETDTLIATSEAQSIGSFSAESIFTYTNTSGADQTLDLVITLTDNGSGEPPSLMKWVAVLSSFQTVTIDEHNTKSGTSYGHRNVAEAITVGAAAWFNTPDVPDTTDVDSDDPPVLNEFSSKGGVPIIFDSEGDSLDNPPQFRDKPDVTAPDGTNNTFFGGDIGLDDDNFPNFFGTSAAAPHAAGVVALMLDRDETLSAGEVKSNLQSGAIDITERSGPFLGTSESDKTPIPDGAGDDAFSGAGLIQADASPPLPVELADFSASSRENASVLTWRTLSEEENAGFEVQRTPAGASDWATIDFVESRAPSGTSTEPQSYRFRDAPLPYTADTLRYRLRQIDLDGSATVTDPITVTRRPSELELKPPSPNPALESATVRFAVPEQQEVTLRLYDVLGRTVQTLTGSAVNGRQEMQVDLSGVPSGTYFLRLQAGGQIEVQQMTVVR